MSTLFTGQPRFLEKEGFKINLWGTKKIIGVFSCSNCEIYNFCKHDCKSTAKKIKNENKKMTRRFFYYKPIETLKKKRF